MCRNAPERGIETSLNLAIQIPDPANQRHHANDQDDHKCFNQQAPKRKRSSTRRFSSITPGPRSLLSSLAGGCAHCCTFFDLRLLPSRCLFLYRSPACKPATGACIFRARRFSLRVITGRNFHSKSAEQAQHRSKLAGFSSLHLGQAVSSASDRPVASNASITARARSASASRATQTSG